MNNMQVLVGNPLEISLRDNAASTGYRWMLVSFPGCLMLEDVDYVAPPGSPVPGKPGKRVFTFLGAQAGEGVVRFAQVRAWDPGQAVSTAEFHVQVTAGGHPPIVVLYGAPIRDAIASGDLARMKTLAAAAEKHLADSADIQTALSSLKAEIARLSAAPPPARPVS